MAKNLVESLARQKRFKKLLTGLVILALMLGMLVVPLEQTHPQANINTFFDGVWWSVTTITSVGYGDTHPVTTGGRIIGMSLELMGVLAFGLIIGLISVTLAEPKERFYWSRLYERLDEMEKKLESIEKQERFMVKQVMEADREN